MDCRLFVPVVAVVGILASPSARAGFACADVCTPDQTCLMLNQGCNPFMNLCQPCQDDSWCAPNGTCQPDGSCANVDCGVSDAGVADAGTSSTADGGPLDSGTSTTSDGGLADSGITDAGTSTTPVDAGFPDTGIAPENPNRNRPRVTNDKGTYDEGCSCDAAPRSDARPWGALALLAVGALGRRGQRRRAGIGPTRRSAKSSV